MSDPKRVRRLPPRSHLRERRRACSASRLMISEPGMCCKVAGKEIVTSSHWREGTEPRLATCPLEHLERFAIACAGKWRDLWYGTGSVSSPYHNAYSLPGKPIELARYESYSFDRECEVNI